MKPWTNRQPHRGFFQICFICLIAFADKSYGQSKVGGVLWTPPTVNYAPLPPYTNHSIHLGGPSGGGSQGDSGVNYQNIGGPSAYPSEAAKQQDLAEIDSMILGLQQVGATDPSHPQHQAYLLAMEGRRQAARTPVNPAGGISLQNPNTSQSADDLRNHFDRVQERAQQQMAADNAKYAALRESGARQLGSPVKGALAGLDAIDAAEAGSRRSSAPRRTMPSSEQVKLNALQGALSDTYENLAGEGWMTPSLFGTSQTQGDGENLIETLKDPARFTPLDPDSLVPPVEIPQNPEAPRPSEMTPAERTQFYTEVDNAFHNKYPEYGNDRIDPATNPEAAHKWLEERDQILASRSQAPVNPTDKSPAEITQLNKKADQAFHEKYPEHGTEAIDPITNPEAAQKWLDERDEILASNAQDQGIDSPAKGTGNSATEGEPSGASVGKADIGSAPPDVIAENGNITPGTSQGAPREGVGATPAGSAGSVAPGNSEMSRSPDGGTAVPDTISGSYKGENAELSGSVTVNPDTGKTFGHGNVTLKGDGISARVGGGVDAAGETTNTLGGSLGMVSGEFQFKESAEKNSLGGSIEVGKDFSVGGSKATAAVEAGVKITGNNYLPEDHTIDSYGGFGYKSLDVDWRLSGKLGALGASFQSNLANGSYTIESGFYSAGYEPGSSRSMALAEAMQADSDQRPKPAREALLSLAEDARQRANRLASQSQLEAATRYYGLYHHYNREANKP